MDKKKAGKKSGELLIAKRPAGKAVKTNFMKNLREFPALQPAHPVEDLIFPKSAELDTQNTNLGHPNLIQTGHPDTISLSAETPKTDFETPKLSTDLSVQTPKQTESGHSKNSNWRKYEKARSTVRVNLHIDRELDKK